MPAQTTAGSESADPFGGVGTVGIEVAMIERGDGVPAAHRLRNVPGPGVLPAPGIGGPVVRAVRTMAGHPGGGERDVGIVEHGVVAAEVDAEDHGQPARTLVGGHDQQIHARRLGRPEAQTEFP